jgi:GT2 family glycosyltransferase
MVSIGLVGPVIVNFKGFTELIKSVDRPVTPYIMDNWTENHGVSKGWNEGIWRGITQDVLIIANDDVIFHPGTIDKLVESAYDVDLVSVVATDTGQEGLHFEGFPDFCCYAIRPRDFVEKFGWFDENFSPAYFEDNDMHYRIKLAGGKSAMRLDAQVDHGGSTTQFWHGEDKRVVSHNMFESNRNYFVRKWGGRPREEIFTRPFNDESKSIKDW